MLQAVLAEVVSKSRNKIHQTWLKPSSRDLYVLVFLYIKKIDFFKMGSNTLLATEQRVFSDGGMDGGGGGCGPSLRDLFGSLLSVLSRGGLVDRRGGHHMYRLLYPLSKQHYVISALFR